MPLDLDSLTKAVDALKRSVNVTNQDLRALSPDLRDTVRAGVIQNFEVAYEQCWKFIQRWIHENRSPADADHPRSRKELFRIAAQCGLISDPSPWFAFGDARNLTTHTYKVEQALAAYEAARRFLAYAEDLLKRLNEMNE